MQTVIMVLHPEKLKNPEVSIAYAIPDRLFKLSNGEITDNGYDFLDEDNSPMAIWLSVDSLEKKLPVILKAVNEEDFLGNNISDAVEIYVSENESEELENCNMIYPK